MSEKPDKPEWRHGEDLSGKKVVPALRAMREAVERALEAEKAKLREAAGIRDSLKK